MAARSAALRLASPPLALERTSDDAATGLPEATRAIDRGAPAEITWVCQDLWTAGDIGLLVGDGGSFKSSTAIHMAGAIAGGYPAFDRFATIRGPVLIVSEEDPEDVIHLRMEAFIAGHGWDRARVLENVHYIAMAGVNLGDARWQLHLRAEVARLGVQFTVFDPLAEMIPGEENSNTDARPVVKFLRRLGSAVAIVHHAGKASPEKRQIDRIRGASAYASASRVTLFFEFSEAGVLVKQPKLSRAPAVEPFMLRREIEHEADNRAMWTAARLTCANPTEVRLTRAQEFVVAQTTASPRMLTTSSLKEAAQGTGISAEDLSRALRTLQALGRIDYEKGTRGAKHWFATTLPNSSGKVEEMRLPTLPDQGSARSDPGELTLPTRIRVAGSHSAVGALATSEDAA